MTELGRLQIKRKTGTEQFRANGIEIGTDLLDFCRWSASDLVNNTMRGVLAEYLVARALGIDTGGVREKCRERSWTIEVRLASISMHCGAGAALWRRRSRAQSRRISLGAAGRLGASTMFRAGLGMTS
jgi:hypothetical protein